MENNSSTRNCENHKFDFKHKKENAINSLFEVEHFLCDIKRICNTFCLYKILKWNNVNLLFLYSIVFMAFVFYIILFFNFYLIFYTVVLLLASEFSSFSITTNGSSNFIKLSLKALFSSPSINIFTALTSVKFVIVFTIE